MLTLLDRTAAAESWARAGAPVTDKQWGALVAAVMDRMSLTAAAAERCASFLFDLAGEKQDQVSASALLSWLGGASDSELRQLSSRYLNRSDDQRSLL